MAYKTKMGKIELPGEAEERNAIAYDHKSLRRLGAVIYSNFAKTQPAAKLPRSLKAAFGGTKYLTETIGISDDAERKYIVQGAKAAAKKAGDAQGMEYLSGLLQELGDKAHFLGKGKAPYQMVSLQSLDRNTPFPGSSPEDRVIESNLAGVTTEVLASLAPTEEKVLRMRFGVDERYHVIEEIGKDFELSRKRIGEVESNALKRLKTRKD